MAWDQTGLALLLEPVAVALDQDGVAVVERAIEDRGVLDLAAEDGAPLRTSWVVVMRVLLRSYLLAMSWKEQVHPALLERQLAELVDHEQLGLAKKERLSFEVGRRTRRALQGRTTSIAH